MFRDLIKAINWVDILVIILLIRTAYIGLSRGFVVEVFKALGVVCALVVSIHNYSRIGEFISSHSFLSPIVSNLISFIVLMCAVLLIFKFLRIILQGLIKIEVTSGLEKFGGIILGLGRGALLGSFILFMLALLPLDYVRDSVDKGSLSGPYLAKVAPAVHDFIIKFSPSQKITARGD